MPHRKLVLITGCGSGLGLALARRLYDDPRYRVVATARGPALEQLRAEFPEKEDFTLRALDVGDDARITALVNEIAVQWGGVDVLINNAGVCYRGVVEHMDTAAELTQLSTNYLGPMSLTRAVLPVMREKKTGGTIINVSSVSGIVPMPTMGSYSASKHALEGATESLWYEARPYGIRVCLVQPGFIHSDSFRNVILARKADLSAKLGGPHSEYYASMAPAIERLMGFARATPESIAEKIVALLEHPDPPLRVPVTADAWLFRLLKWFLPAGLFHRVLFRCLPGSRAWGEPGRATALSPGTAPGIGFLQSKN